MFFRIYRLTLDYARHRHALWFLTLVSFAESSFFPVPPDVMLAPMVLARPERAAFLALITTVSSVCGGIFGYGIGYFAFETIEPWLHRFGYWESYVVARQWFDQWGFWAVFVAGFSPIPYKVFTITAGALAMALPPFALASFIGRGGRFFLVAAILRWGGVRLESGLRRHIDRLGWITVGLVVVGIVVSRAVGR